MADMIKKGKSKLKGVHDPELSLGEALKVADLSRWGYDTVRPKTMVEKAAASAETQALDAHAAQQNMRTGPVGSKPDTYGVETDTQAPPQTTKSAGIESTSGQDRKQ